MRACTKYSQEADSDDIRAKAETIKERHAENIMRS